MKKDLEELLNDLRTYENRASEIDGEKASLDGKYEKLTTDVDRQGEKLHDEVDIFINKRKIKISKMKNRHLATLDEQKEEVLSLISELEQSMKHINEMLDTNEVWKVSEYKSKNTSTDVEKLPSQIQLSLPEISSQEIISEKFCKMFSYLLPLSLLKNEKDREEENVVGECPVCSKRLRGYRRPLRRVARQRQPSE